MAFFEPKGAENYARLAAQAGNRSIDYISQLGATLSKGITNQAKINRETANKDALLAQKSGYTGDPSEESKKISDKIGMLAKRGQEQYPNAKNPYGQEIDALTSQLQSIDTQGRKDYAGVLAGGDQATQEKMIALDRQAKMAGRADQLFNWKVQDRDKALLKEKGLEHISNQDVNTAWGALGDKINAGILADEKQQKKDGTYIDPTKYANADLYNEAIKERGDNDQFDSLANEKLNNLGQMEMSKADRATRSAELTAQLAKYGITGKEARTEVEALMGTGVKSGKLTDVQKKQYDISLKKIKNLREDKDLKSGIKTNKAGGKYMSTKGGDKALLDVQTKLSKAGYESSVIGTDYGYNQLLDADIQFKDKEGKVHTTTTKQALQAGWITSDAVISIVDANAEWTLGDDKDEIRGTALKHLANKIDPKKYSGNNLKAKLAKNSEWEQAELSKLSASLGGTKEGRSQNEVVQTLYDEIRNGGKKKETPGKDVSGKTGGTDPYATPKEATADDLMKSLTDRANAPIGQGIAADNYAALTPDVTEASVNADPLAALKEQVKQEAPSSAPLKVDAEIAVMDKLGIDPDDVKPIEVLRAIEEYSKTSARGLLPTDLEAARKYYEGQYGPGQLFLDAGTQGIKGVLSATGEGLTALADEAVRLPVNVARGFTGGSVLDNPLQTSVGGLKESLATSKQEAAQELGRLSGENPEELATAMEIASIAIPGGVVGLAKLLKPLGLRKSRETLLELSKVIRNGKVDPAALQSWTTKVRRTSGTKHYRPKPSGKYSF